MDIALDCDRFVGTAYLTDPCTSLTRDITPDQPFILLLIFSCLLIRKILQMLARLARLARSGWSGWKVGRNNP